MDEIAEKNGHVWLRRERERIRLRARRVLVAEAGATLVAVAKDVKIQIDGSDPDGYCVEFIRLVDLAASLDVQKLTSTR